MKPIIKHSLLEWHNGGKLVLVLLGGVQIPPTKPFHLERGINFGGGYLLKLFNCHFQNNIVIKILVNLN